MLLRETQGKCVSYVASPIGVRMLPSNLRLDIFIPMLTIERRTNPTR
jgi:hypothetical protein